MQGKCTTNISTTPRTLLLKSINALVKLEKESTEKVSGEDKRAIERKREK